MSSEVDHNDILVVLLQNGNLFAILSFLNAGFLLSGCLLRAWAFTASYLHKSLVQIPNLNWLTLNIFKRLLESLWIDIWCQSTWTINDHVYDILPVQVCVIIKGANLLVPTRQIIRSNTDMWASGISIVMTRQIKNQRGVICTLHQMFLFSEPIFQFISLAGAKLCRWLSESTYNNSPPTFKNDSWSPSMLVPCILELHLGAQTIQERSYGLIKVNSLCMLVWHWWRGLTLCICVAWRMLNHDNAMCVAQHNVQYTKLSVRHTQHNSHAHEIMLANKIPTLIPYVCIFGQWEVVRD